ncbi:MAG: HNH endonuclease [Lachnospiraceae bacterium]|nr:HNH endonuclease [Lachnospiraceae bacterium]
MTKDNIIYCNIGEMQEYNGNDKEKPIGGGEYNTTEVGHEVNNFTKSKDKFYGYVRTSSETIAVENHFTCLSYDKKYAEHVLVVWVVDKKRIVGWYKDAIVYREYMKLDTETASNRVYNDYNIVAEDVMLLPENDRIDMKYKFGRNNIWYGNEEKNKETIRFIEKYEAEVEIINSSEIKGEEKEVLIKQRINQSRFRQGLLNKYKCKCALCGMSLEATLIASHIKPWSKSDSCEKVDIENGLLLCPNHDKLFDEGYISFDNDGKIMISSILDADNCIKLNVVSKMKIMMSDRLKIYMEYHRNNRYKQ